MPKTFNPGILDREIVIQSITRSQNSTGEAEETLSTFATVAANFLAIRGAEPQNAGAQQGQTQARFRIRHLDGLKMEMKISYDSLTWDITEIRPLGRRDYIDVIALALRN